MENPTDQKPTATSPTDEVTQPGVSGSSKTEIEMLQEQIKKLEAESKEKDNKYVYLYAEFENFKKRSIRERSEMLRFASEPIAKDLLQVIDNLERAIEHTPAGTDKNLIQGLQMVVGQFWGLLEKQGVQKIQSLEKPFDPNLHEAVGQENSKHPAGVVVREHQRGYTIHGRLLRPARVLISSGTAPQASGLTDSNS